MSTTRRSLILGTAVAAGVVAVVSDAGGQSATEQGTCIPEACDPFPLFGDKRIICKDEFNAMAGKAADETVLAVLATNAELSQQAQEEIRQAAYSSVESMYLKFYIIE